MDTRTKLEKEVTFKRLYENKGAFLIYSQAMKRLSDSAMGKEEKPVVDVTDNSKGEVIHAITYLREVGCEIELIYGTGRQVSLGVSL